MNRQSKNIGHDLDIIKAYKEREIQVEYRLNVIRVALVLLLIIADLLVTKLWNKGELQIIFEIVCLVLVYFYYFFLVYTIRSSEIYRPWLKYMTTTVDYLLTVVVFLEYRHAYLFRNISNEILVSHFVAILVFINLLSIIRYSPLIIFYSTTLGLTVGMILVVNYIPLSSSTFFSPLIIFMSGLLTLWFSSDINDLFVKLRRRDKLKKFLSKEIVERVDQGTMNIALGGEKKEVTILIADIRNYTKMAERTDPYEIVTILNTYFTSMSEIIFHNGGVIDKYIGDAILAIFGIPKAKPDDAMRAIQTAIKMQEGIIKFNETRKSDSHDPFEIGIAIHSGTVVAGNIGSPKRMEYTIIGDAVNVAARIEGLNKTHGTKILISHVTYEKAKDCIDMDFVTETYVTGRREPIKIFTIKNPTEKFKISKASEIFRELSLLEQNMAASSLKINE